MFTIPGIHAGNGFKDRPVEMPKKSTRHDRLLAGGPAHIPGIDQLLSDREEKTGKPHRGRLHLLG